MPETPLPEDKGLAQCPTTTPVSNRQFDQWRIMMPLKLGHILRSLS